MDRRDEHSTPLILRALVDGTRLKGAQLLDDLLDAGVRIDKHFRSTTFLEAMDQLAEPRRSCVFVGFAACTAAHYEAL